MSVEVQSEIQAGMREAFELGMEKGRMELLKALNFLQTFAVPAPVGVSLQKSFSEDDHPRDDGGRFVSKEDIAAAANDPEKAKELHARVTDPEEKKKLAKAIGESQDNEVDNKKKPSKNKDDKKPRRQPRITDEAKLATHVRRSGGIDPQSHEFLRFHSGVNEAMEYGVPLTVFRKGGLPLDIMAMQLHEAGLIHTPEGRDHSEHLMEQLAKGAKSALADTTAEMEKAYYEHEQNRYLASLEHSDAEIASAIRLGEEAGNLEAEAIEATEDSGADDRFGEGGNEAFPEGSTEFEFGANEQSGSGKQVKPKAAPRRTVEKTVAALTKIAKRDKLTATDMLIITEAITSHTHAEISEVKKQLGIKTSGTKAAQAAAIAARIVERDKTDQRRFSHPRLSVDEAKDHVDKFIANKEPKPGDAARLANVLANGLTGKELAAIKTHYGIKASGEKSEMALKIARKLAPKIANDWSEQDAALNAQATPTPTPTETTLAPAPPEPEPTPEQQPAPEPAPEPEQKPAPVPTPQPQATPRKRGEYEWKPVQGLEGTFAWHKGDKQATGPYGSIDDADRAFKWHKLKDGTEQPEPEKPFKEHPQYARLDRTYGKMSAAEIDDHIAQLNAQQASHQKAAKREFSGTGYRRTGAAISSEANSDIGNEKLLLNLYKKDKFEPEQQPATQPEPQPAQASKPATGKRATDLFGNPLPKRWPTKKGEQLNIEDQLKTAWVDHAHDFASELGSKVSKIHAGGQFDVNGKRYRVGLADEGYPIHNDETGDVVRAGQTSGPVTGVGQSQPKAESKPEQKAKQKPKAKPVPVLPTRPVPTMAEILEHTNKAARASFAQKFEVSKKPRVRSSADDDELGGSVGPAEPQEHFDRFARGQGTLADVHKHFGKAPLPRSKVINHLSHVGIGNQKATEFTTGLTKIGTQKTYVGDEPTFDPVEIAKQLGIHQPEPETKPVTKEPEAAPVPATPAPAPATPIRRAMAYEGQDRPEHARQAAEATLTAEHATNPQHWDALASAGKRDWLIAEAKRRGVGDEAKKMPARKIVELLRKNNQG